MYEIRYSPSVTGDLNDLKVFWRRQILDSVDEIERILYVRAVRHKPAHKTTEEIL